ncbi:hypothetical protein FIBSPDRAFT_963646 [Athelia psychrophila]|uniref:Nephrocystin 3-like N-terminal domain-containing protein n=1 Tax=Athelia psychrophila TaxID=1759441 RepID=A0A165YPN1_9AGAM|nr:hypothetical protein FIBSPDRAFT_963646 [Fibularhizoctonia sp. CBS 109695]
MILSSRSFSLKRATTADIPDLNRIFTEAVSDDNDTMLKYLHEPDPRGAKYAMMKGALDPYMSKPGKCTVMKAVIPRDWLEKPDEEEVKASIPAKEEEGRYEIEAAVDNTPEKIKHLAEPPPALPCPTTTIASTKSIVFIRIICISTVTRYWWQTPAAQAWVWATATGNGDIHSKTHAFTVALADASYVCVCGYRCARRAGRSAYAVGVRSRSIGERRDSEVNMADEEIGENRETGKNAEPEEDEEQAGIWHQKGMRARARIEFKVRDDTGAGGHGRRGREHPGAETMHMLARTLGGVIVSSSGPSAEAAEERICHAKDQDAPTTEVPPIMMRRVWNLRMGRQVLVTSPQATAKRHAPPIQSTSFVDTLCVLGTRPDTMYRAVLHATAAEAFGDIGGAKTCMGRARTSSDMDALTSYEEARTAQCCAAAIERMIKREGVSRLGSIGLYPDFVVPDAGYQGSGPRSRCLKGTREAVIGKILDWKDDIDGSSIRSVSGPAGFGKSAVAQTIAQLCATNGTLVASFFFLRGAGGRSDFGRFITTLAFQITQSVPETKPTIEKALRDDPTIVYQYIANQLQKLVLSPMMALAATLIGIIASTGSSGALPFRWLLTSRREGHIQQAFATNKSPANTTSVTLEDFDAALDIAKNLKHRFSIILEQNPRLMKGVPLPWPSDEDLPDFITDEKGHPQQKLKSVLSLHAGLNPLYDQVLRAVPDVTRFRGVLTTPMVLQAQPSINTLANLLQLDVEAMLTETC